MVQRFLRNVCRDIGSLKSLHTLFDKYFDHMLVKLEHSALAKVTGKSLMANLLQELIFLSGTYMLPLLILTSEVESFSIIQMVLQLCWWNFNKIVWSKLL